MSLDIKNAMIKYRIPDMPIYHNFEGLKNTLNNVIDILNGSNTDSGTFSNSDELVKVGSGGTADYLSELDFRRTKAGHIRISADVSSPWKRYGSSIYYKKGNVGVGLSDPQYDFDIAGDINLTGYLYMDSEAWIQNPADRNTFIGEGVRETPGAAGTNDYIYLAYSASSEVRKYWADSLVYEDVVGSSGSGDGEFSNVYGVCSDGTHFYTIENVNDRIQKFLCSDLSFVAKAGSGGSGDGQFDNAQGICTDGTYLYIADTNNSRIQKFNCSDLAYVAQVGSAGSGDNQFSVPEEVCTDGTYFYIADSGNHRIKKHLCSDLAYVAKIGSSGSGDDQFLSPHGVGTDGTYVYVVDNNNRVNQRNCSDLTYVSKIGTTGSGDDQFENPKRVTVDNTGTYFFVSDDSNKRIVKRKCSDLGYINEVSVPAIGSYGLGFSGEIDTDFLDNTITGYNAGNVLSTGDRNSLYGAYAGDHLLGGKDNVFVGYQAGDTATSAKQCIVIGSTADISATLVNSMAIGYGASASTSNKISIGNSSIEALEFPWMTTAGMLINSGAGAITSLTDPGADRIAFWDDSETSVAWLTTGNSIAITTTTLDTIQDIRTTASPTFNALTLTNTSEPALSISMTSITGTDNQAIDITSVEALDANEHWTGIRVKPDGLDPGGADTRIRGLALNMSGIDPGAYDMDLEALRIVMPNNGYDAIRIKEGKVRHLQTITSTAFQATTAHDITIDASAQVSTSESHALDVALASTLGGGHVAAVGTHDGIDPIHQHIGTFTSFGATYAGRLTSGPTYTDDIDDKDIWVAASDSILVGHTAKFDEIELVFGIPATKDCFLKFYFYQTTTGWVQFYPEDDTDGGRQDGIIRYSGDDLTDWQSDYDPGTGADAGYWIKIHT